MREARVCVWGGRSEGRLERRLEGGPPAKYIVPWYIFILALLVYELSHSTGCIRKWHRPYAHQAL